MFPGLGFGERFRGNTIRGNRTESLQEENLPPRGPPRGTRGDLSDFMGVSHNSRAICYKMGVLHKCGCLQGVLDGVPPTELQLFDAWTKASGALGEMK